MKKKVVQIPASLLEELDKATAEGHALDPSHKAYKDLRKFLRDRAKKKAAYAPFQEAQRRMNDPSLTRIERLRNAKVFFDRYPAGKKKWMIQFAAELDVSPARRKSMFNDFEQNVYDFDELEEMLLRQQEEVFYDGE